jgi:hypothetical protein
MKLVGDVEDIRSDLISKMKQDLQPLNGLMKNRQDIQDPIKDNKTMYSKSRDDRFKLYKDKSDKSVSALSSPQVSLTDLGFSEYSKK